MSRKKQAGRRHPGAGQVNRGLPKRRLPLALPKKEPLLPARPPAPTEVENPYVIQIVEHIRRVCAIASLPPFVVLEDWTGMLEAALRLYADNARTYAMTGQFIDDPPGVKEVYRRARERYLKATETYPAAYWEMQVAFSQTFALPASIQTTSWARPSFWLHSLSRRMRRAKLICTGITSSTALSPQQWVPGLSLS